MMKQTKSRNHEFDYEEFCQYDSDDDDRYIFCGGNNYSDDDDDDDYYDDDDDSDGTFSDPEANFNKYSGLTQVKLFFIF